MKRELEHIGLHHCCKFRCLFHAVDLDMVLHRPYMGPLTPKFDTATWPFLKIDLRHGAYRQEGNYKRHDI